MSEPSSVAARPAADGPYECAVLAFGEGGIPPGLVNALLELVEYGTIRILDVVFASADADGVTILEIDDLEDDLRDLFTELDGEYDGLISTGDIEELAAELTPGTTVAIIVWQNVWVSRVIAAVREGGGVLLAHERVSAQDVEATLSSRST
jgi:hypothetical protein